MKSPTIPTSEGQKTIPEIMDSLMWGSYSANRGYGMSHERLIQWGIGNEAMKERYEWDQVSKLHHNKTNQQ